MKTDNRFPATITAGQMHELYLSISNNCNWKLTIYREFGKQMLDNTPCTVEEDLYRKARKDAEEKHHRLLDKIFGKDKQEYPYEYGELIFVKNDIKSPWELRYANGMAENDGRILAYADQHKEGTSLPWKYHAPAKGVKLPD